MDAELSVAVEAHRSGPEAEPNLAARPPVSAVPPLRALGYTETRDRLREELALSELQLSETRDEQVDIEGVLAFAEHVIGNACTLDDGFSQGQTCAADLSVPRWVVSRARWTWNRCNFQCVQLHTRDF